jgi:zinc protease
VYQKIKRISMIGIFLSLLFSSLFIISAEAGLSEKVYETTLPNGLKVIFLENHKAPLITFQIWYRVGSRNEEWGKTGLSHMLEHMMFKGTKKVGPEDFSRIIQENGGNDNAFTSRDFTAYFETLSADRIQIAIDLESDRMQNLVLRQKDFRTEHMVVMEERRLRTDDNPQAFLMEQIESAAYQIQPYHWPTIGWMEDISRFTLQDVKDYHRTYYSPSNAFIVVVGDFHREELLPRIEKAFGSISGGKAPDQRRDIDPKQTGERRIIVKKKAQLPFLVMGYHVPNISNPDSYVLEVIASLLSEGKSSRLYKKLIHENQLAVSVDASNSLLSKDPSLFYVSAEPLPGKKVSEVEAALDREILRLQKEPVPDHELEKAKNQLEADFVYSQDSLFYQAMLLARNEIALSWKKIDNYIPSIRKITSGDISRVAKKYLTPDNRTVGILIPITSEGSKSEQGRTTIRENMIR